MLKNVNTLQTSMRLARYAGTLQAITARNIANADTPNFRPNTIEPFEKSVKRGSQNAPFDLRITRGKHLGQSAKPSHSVTTKTTGNDPNGNGVQLEQEILNSVSAKRQHDRALAIYRASLEIVRSAISKQ